MNARIMSPQDRQAAAKLLSEHYKLGEFPADFLPETGVVVEESGRIICVIPVYLENTSSVAVLGHFIANDTVPRRILHDAAVLAIERAKNFARIAGKQYILSLFGRKSINKIVDSLGFVTTDTTIQKFYHIGGNHG